MSDGEGDAMILIGLSLYLLLVWIAILLFKGGKEEGRARKRALEKRSNGKGGLHGRE